MAQWAADGGLVLSDEERSRAAGPPPPGRAFDGGALPHDPALADGLTNKAVIGVHEHTVASGGAAF